MKTKALIITEKPSVAMEFARALNVSGKKDGYIEDGQYVITWCVGHLVTMSYPEKYDPELKKWKFEDLPFLPGEYRYEVIPGSSAQYRIVAGLMNRDDISRIYYSGDSGREGEYIQRLVRQLAGRNPAAEEFRVWIDSQTEDEIRRGLAEAKPLSAYDSLSESAYARAIEDYSIGINYSRAVTLKFGRQAAAINGMDRVTVAVGRVMSCVLGMVVRREREIRSNIRTPYFTVSADVEGPSGTAPCRFAPREDSPFYRMEDLYMKKGFLDQGMAERFAAGLDPALTLDRTETQRKKKYAPLLYNLAELQADCTKLWHLSPDRTLTAAQALYEKKLTTYPRTDARVLTTAMCRVIRKNITGLTGLTADPAIAEAASDAVRREAWQGLERTKYVDDSAVTDHYAIIPTGLTDGVESLDGTDREVYFLVCRRFLSIFFPPAELESMQVQFSSRGETFQAKLENLLSPGWMEVAGNAPDTSAARDKMKILGGMEEGKSYPASFSIKREETQPPKRYTSGSMVLAMENAGRLIEDEELREQIRGTGIGTSATRADTIKKLIDIKYIQCNSRQTLAPTLLGETVYEILALCAPRLLSPEMTASWEKGLQGICDGKVSRNEYLDKLYTQVARTVGEIESAGVSDRLAEKMGEVSRFYGKSGAQPAAGFQCPLCSRPLRKGKSGYFCTGRDQGCQFVLWETWCRKKLTDTQVKALLSGKRTSLIKGFQSGSGKTFSARLRLVDGKIVPEFT